MSSTNKIGGDPILAAAKYYFEQGLPPHWLRPRSKAPVKPGWTEGTRASLEALRKEYVPGYGVGIRLGMTLGDGGGSLIVIDMDIRSPDLRYRAEAEELIDKLFPGLRATAPCVETGRGFGSAHFYSLSPEPLKNEKLGRSSELVKVFSPSSESSKKQQSYVSDGRLTSEELAKGFRLKAAWELELMSEGKQVVAPPTLHPDTGRAYRWIKGLT